jgi:aromatic-L-amino-acid decarboxylase
MTRMRESSRQNARQAGILPPMEPSQARHMSAEEFRRHGREMIDWIAEYLETCEKYPVQSQVKPGEILSRLPASPPVAGEAWQSIFKDVEKIILPGIMHWQSPNFFGYFPANNSYPSILGELLSAGLGVQGMLWSTSPACTELEMRVLDWCAEMLALPQKFQFADSPSLSEGRRQGLGESHRTDSSMTRPPTPSLQGRGSSGGGVILDTASSATLCAMIAARERITRGESNRAGVRAATQQLVAYASSQAHSSVEKAARICGIGSENLRFINVNQNFTMDVDHLGESIDRDRAGGLVPFFVCATVGTTSSNAIDPVREIGEVLKGGHAVAPRPSPKRGGKEVWLHIDAAMSGTAALCPEFRWIHDGIELADSYCFNPHKWMLTNFDCDCFYVADRAALIKALSILPEYLRNQASESGGVIDYRDWQIPLGRRFRALKLWFVIRHYGVQGLQEHVREHVRLAQEFAAWVRDDPHFDIAAPHPLNLVCFRHKGSDSVNQCILDSINGSGAALLTHTKLDGKLTLRLAIGGSRTEKRHVERVWAAIRHAAGLPYRS